MKQFSDQDLQTLLRLPPQQQAEQMMMAGVNHYEGATGMVMERVQSWRGQLKKTPNWDTVELAARYSSDLRVRDAAIEVDLTMFQLEKSSAAADRLLDDAQANVANRGFDLTMLGMLANRGVETGRIHSALRDWAHNPDEGTRFWAIEGLAYIGTEDTIPDFLEVLRNDPSLNVRQRCGASLAKSGMLTRDKRMAAVPGLLEIGADSSQSDVVRGWAFRALHEITAEPIGNDAAAWRSWFETHGSERVEQFRRGDPNAVLGNS
jgi:HEAT repeat protein